MSYITEKKAHELFDQYMKAELEADPTRKDAIALEKQLNDGGWFITSSPDGLTVKKKGMLSGVNVPSVDGFTPTETRIQPYQGGTQTSYKPFWITLGIVAGLLALTALVIYVVKQHKKKITNVRVA